MRRGKLQATIGWVEGNASQNITKVVVGIDSVQVATMDQREEDGHMFTPPEGLEDQPVPPAYPKNMPVTFNEVIGEVQKGIIQVPDQGNPLIDHVLASLEQVAFGRLGDHDVVQPGLKFILQKGFGDGLPCPKTFSRCQVLGLPFHLEEPTVDVQGKDGPAVSSKDIFKPPEGMAMAADLFGAIGRKDLVMAAPGIGEDKPFVAVQDLSGKVPILSLGGKVNDVSGVKIPKESPQGDFGAHPLRWPPATDERVVYVGVMALKDLRQRGPNNGLKKIGYHGHPITQCGSGERESGVLEAKGIPVQGYMVQDLFDGGVNHGIVGGQRFGYQIGIHGTGEDEPVIPRFFDIVQMFCRVILEWPSGKNSVQRWREAGKCPAVWDQRGLGVKGRMRRVRQILFQGFMDLSRLLGNGLVSGCDGRYLGNGNGRLALIALVNGCCWRRRDFGFSRGRDRWSGWLGGGKREPVLGGGDRGAKRRSFGRLGGLRIGGRRGFLRGNRCLGIGSGRGCLGSLLRRFPIFSVNFFLIGSDDTALNGERHGVNFYSIGGFVFKGEMVRGRIEEGHSVFINGVNDFDDGDMSGGQERPGGFSVFMISTPFRMFILTGIFASRCFWGRARFKGQGYGREGIKEIRGKIIEVEGAVLLSSEKPEKLPLEFLIDLAEAFDFGTVLSQLGKGGIKFFLEFLVGR